MAGMLAQTMNSVVSIRGAPVAARPQKAQKPASRTLVVAAQRQKADEQRQGPPDVLLKAFGVATAVQMAVLPIAGPALAKRSDGNEPPIESTKRQAGDAQKKLLSDGAFDPKLREQRNTKNAEGLVNKFDLIKQRNSTAGALANNGGGTQNIFAPSRNTDGKEVLKPRGQPVSFKLDAARAPALTFATISLPDLGSTTPKVDPEAPSSSSKQNDLAITPEGAVQAAKETVEGLKDRTTSQDNKGGLVQGFKDTLNGAAITDKSPAKQLTDLQKQTSWVAGGPLQLTFVGADPGGAGGASRDLESNYGGENSIGGPTTGDPKKGGDLKDSANKFALEFQGEKPTKDSAGFGSGSASNSESVKNIRDTNQQVPNFAGGKGFLRDDNISPEQAAQDNIATARAGKGSILDSAAKSAGIQ